MSKTTLKLMDTYLFGRDLQNALLAFIYRDADSRLKKAIETALLSSTLDLNESELKELASLVKNSIDRIHGEKPGPKLYKAGKPDDAGILREAGLQPPTGKEGGSWRDSLTSYFEKIAGEDSNIGNLLKPCNKYPMLTRAYLFSLTRGSMVELKDKDTECLSVALAMAGAYISLVAGGESEIYVVPDGSLNSVRKGSLTYSILLAEWLDPEKPPHRLSDLIGYFTGIGNSSPDISLLLALLSHVLFYKDKVGTSIEPEIFNGYRLVRIVAGNRPQIMWSTPLTMISKVLASEEASKRLARVLSGLSELSELASSMSNKAKRSKAVGTGSKKVEDVVGMCLGSVYRYIETWSLDQLVECASGLSRLASSVSNDIQKDIKTHAKETLKAISCLTQGGSSYEEGC